MIPILQECLRCYLVVSSEKVGCLDWSPRGPNGYRAPCKANDFIDRGMTGKALVARPRMKALKLAEDICRRQQLRIWGQFGVNWCQEASWWPGLSAGSSPSTSLPEMAARGRSWGSCWSLPLKTFPIAVNTAMLEMRSRIFWKILSTIRNLPLRPIALNNFLRMSNAFCLPYNMPCHQASCQGRALYNVYSRQDTRRGNVLDLTNCLPINIVLYAVWLSKLWVVS